MSESSAPSNKRRRTEGVGNGTSSSFSSSSSTTTKPRTGCFKTETGLPWVITRGGQTISAPLVAYILRYLDWREFNAVAQTCRFLYQTACMPACMPREIVIEHPIDEGNNWKGFLTVSQPNVVSIRSFHADILAICKQFPGLTSLSFIDLEYIFNWKTVNRETLEAIGQLTHLKHLEITSSQAIGLEQVSWWTSADGLALETLRLGGPFFYICSIQSLPWMKQLTSLDMDIHYCFAWNPTAMISERMPNLKKLVLRNVRENQQGVGVLPNLTHLEVHSNSIRHAMIDTMSFPNGTPEFSRSCPNLEFLHYSANVFHPTFLAEVGRLPRLSNLVLDGEIGPIREDTPNVFHQYTTWISQWSQLTNLRHFSGFSGDCRLYVPLAQLTQLTSLDIKGIYCNFLCKHPLDKDLVKVEQFCKRLQPSS